AIRQIPATDGENGGGDQPQQKVFTLTGAAAFRGEKLAGRLNEEETQGLLFIKDEAYGGIIPIAYDSTRKNISFLFRDVKTKLTPVIKKEGITFQIKIKGTGEVIGTTPQTIDITKKSNVNKMEGLINQEVERRCRNSVAKAQAMRVDLFGFGDRIHRTYPQVWKEIENQWDDIFPHIDVDIKAEFSVEHSGLTDKSLEIN
ncbi:MAG: Ger(x)C family spore germination C-terminal domain-containing protein, partial [Syntrophaceticus sp.]